MTAQVKFRISCWCLLLPPSVCSGRRQAVASVLPPSDIEYALHPKPKHQETVLFSDQSLITFFDQPASGGGKRELTLKCLFFYSDWWKLLWKIALSVFLFNKLCCLEKCANSVLPPYLTLTFNNSKKAGSSLSLCIYLYFFFFLVSPPKKHFHSSPHVFQTVLTEEFVHIQL